MRESEMAVVVVAAAAAIAAGGAAIALMYHCCQDQAARKQKHHHKKTTKIVAEEGREDLIQQEEIESEGQGIRREEHVYHQRQEQVDQVGKSKRPAAVKTVEEIKAFYGRPSRKDAAATAGMAAEARNRLVERGEKLQAVSDKTQELESGAENFASLAEELAKKMKARKWWQL